MDADYYLISHWHIPGDLGDVAEILSEPRDLVRWWPEVYLAVNVVDEGNEDGVGKVAEVHSRGLLPYTLRSSFRVVESRWPHGATIEAWGDLVGRGTWSLEQNGEHVNAKYEWRVRADKPLLRLLSPLLKPLFAWNHRWAMAKVEAGLKHELQRRRNARADDNSAASDEPAE
jgi:hypothetical protein